MQNGKYDSDYDRAMNEILNGKGEASFPEWFSVSELLPENLEEVIIRDKWACRYSAYLGKDGSFYRSNGLDDRKIEGVTHWMRIPDFNLTGV